jgi:microcin C transport system ATP-binding protein
MALLRICNLRIAFPEKGNTNEVVRGINLDIEKNEVFALVGASGSGKTVTAQSIMRLLSSESSQYLSGEIFFDGIDTLSCSDLELRKIRGREIGIIFQEPMTSLNPLHTIKKQLSESIQLHRGVNGDEREAQYWIERVGIRHAERRMNSYPHQLSGGERQRVMIAMALINRPKLLIADEPTTALDVTIEAQILGLLKALQKEIRMSILFITHDLGLVKKFSDKTAVMRNGKIVETGTTKQIFESPVHEYTKKLLGAEKIESPPKAESLTKNILLTKNLKVWFPIQDGFLRLTTGYVKAVDGVTISLHKGQSLGVVGESGSGKTTLGKALLRLLKSEGYIEFDGIAISVLEEKNFRKYRKRIQIIFQDPYGSLSPRMTVHQIIGEGLRVHDISFAKNHDSLICDAMGEVGLNPATRFRYPHEFSGGERQRIAIARALVLKPELIVLDEPTSSLDRTIQFQVLELLKKLQKKHSISYIFISHDLRVVKSLCHSLIIMKGGKVVEHGLAADIFDNPKHPYTQALLHTAFH